MSYVGPDDSGAVRASTTLLNQKGDSGEFTATATLNAMLRYHHHQTPPQA